MKSLQEVYPPVEGSNQFSESNYEPLLESLGHVILLKVDDADYQGDSRVLFLDDERVGLLIFGWGSCSGCDALQACNTYKEAEDLRQDLSERVQWFDTPLDALGYFNRHDWEGDYSFHQSETHTFIRRGKVLLQELVSALKEPIFNALLTDRSVLADWCEERDYKELAQSMRAG